MATSYRFREPNYLFVSKPGNCPILTTASKKDTNAEGGRSNIPSRPPSGAGDRSWEVLSHMMFLGTPLLLHTYTHLST